MLCLRTLEKFMYLISTNTGEIITILAALILLPGLPLIFTPVQILWVNLVTDGLLDKFIAMEPKEAGIMDRPPRKPKEKIINRDMLLNILFVGALMAIGTLDFHKRIQRWRPSKRSDFSLHNHSAVSSVQRT